MNDTTSVPRSTQRIYVMGAAMVLVLLSAYTFPQIDHALNPSARTPGLISFLGVGLSVLALTAVLLFMGLRGVLPRSRLFLAAAFGYNALLVLIKFALGPIALYAVSEQHGYIILSTDGIGVGGLAFPGVAAITAILYASAFFILYAVYNSRLKSRLGVPVRIERSFITLFVSMFVIAVVGGVTVIGLIGFLEYALSFLQVAVLGVLLAVALIGAISLCATTFREATERAVLLRNVTLLSTFAWVGLAFIAAYHILWLVFVLTLVSLWPLKAFSVK